VCTDLCCRRRCGERARSALYGKQHARFLPCFTALLSTQRARAGLAFADFVKVLGTIVEPKIPRASAVAPAASAGLAAFEQLCRRQLTGSLKKRDLAAFLRSPDPLAADETERFMRFVSDCGARRAWARTRARRHHIYLSHLSFFALFLSQVGLGDAAPSDDVEYRTVIASLIAAARSSRA
jgi:hypothetical protein